MPSLAAITQEDMPENASPIHEEKKEEHKEEAKKQQENNKP